jgi:RHH-type proline utilization regulon transcriptional repressor/proline dehydrogenase/delta 1-pyrroline-5-carboxylate dehydrogenase
VPALPRIDPAPMQRLWRADERECLPPLIAAAELPPARAARALQRARWLIEGARQERGSVAALTRQLALDSPAGIALLTLAEALLRVPDAVTADRLIRDQLAGLDRGGGVRGALAGALRLAAATTRAAGRADPRRAAVPLLRHIVRWALTRLGGQFIFGQSIEAALERARRGSRAGYRYSFDMLGEAALTDADARGYYGDYERAIRAVGVANALGSIAASSVSVKLSALHPRYGYAQRAPLMQQLMPRLRALALLAQRYRTALTIDAEEADRLEPSLELLEALMTEPALAGWAGLGVAVQAYQKRAPAVIDYLAALAARHRQPLSVRLVKGAYWDLEIKLAQQEGLAGYPVYTRKCYTDVAYLACARRLLAARAHLRPQFATHNAQTVAHIIELAQMQSAGPGPGIGANAGAGVHAGAADLGLEFQCLYGMGAALYRRLSRLPGGSPPVRIYAPVGAHAALLPYLMRRLLENGAGNSFVHRAMRAPAEALATDPVPIAARLAGAPHPRIRLPCELFLPERRNSAGIDLADAQQRGRLRAAIEHSRRAPIEVGPMLAVEDAAAAPASPGAPAAPYPRSASRAAHAAEAQREIRNPADRNELIGMLRPADEYEVDAALAAAVQGACAWAASAINSRAAVLEHAADLYEQNMEALVAVVVREAGRTLANAIGEVREAVDHLRYYAARIRAEFDAATHVPLGVVACISPWNFPLAIFTGQVAAALAAGNAVLAKPAEQTGAVASLAVRLLRSAGVPSQVLQLLPGAGERIGMQLVSDARIGGVVFTGSTGTARAIARALAERPPVPLIAETGGQNAMIVDSSALPEQVVADVLRSAFDSAGQRCSSLRVLCLQHEIAGPILRMLEGAMRQLRVGDPARISTDVGPLIDERACERIRSHLQRLRGSIRCQAALTGECARGVFLAPTLVQLESIAQLPGEVFGPVLHVVRFERRRLGELLDDIDATGYGLTLGIASRVASTVEQILERARAGNVYVNRNMIGAVVGVQPFGGCGLSGTGPKSGGPLYLHGMLRRSPGPRWSAPRPVPEALRVLIDWLSRQGGGLQAAQREQLRQRAEGYAQRTLAGARLRLDGYVGESNELRLRPRGLLRATARTATALLDQLAAALASGNTLCSDHADLAAGLEGVLPIRLHGCLRRDAGECQAVLVDAAEAAEHASWLQRLRRELAAAEGPIVPTVIADPLDGYPLHHLLTEQTITVNTAAVGGDAQLLALADEEAGG